MEFAALMEKADPKDGAALHKVAAELQKRFCPETGVVASAETKKAVAKKPEKTEPKDELPVVVNPPLGFELKDLDAEHPYLLSRGLTPETIQHFGLGFCSRGLLKDRVAIPLHDMAGALVGYAGRVVDDATSQKTIRATDSLGNASVTARCLNSERRCFYTTVSGSKRPLTI